MALVTMKTLLERAENHHRGIGAFSVGNMEMVKGAVQAAEELKTPIILQIAEVRLKHSPLALMGPLMVQAAKEAEVDIAVHLDHGLTMETVEKALELGFTSVMFDSSTYPLEENIERTRRVVELAKNMAPPLRQNWDWLAEVKTEVRIMESAVQTLTMQNYFVSARESMHWL